MSELSLMNNLESRMQWLSGRQQVLTQNIANADTPGYRAMDVSEPSFKTVLKGMAAVPMSETNRMHMTSARPSLSAGVATVNRRPTEVYPTGNSVNLEDETRKATQNVMDFQLVSSIYKKQINMLMTAAGKQR
ncbi:MAG TPA: flagellar basal body rod protein FlgB [Alphaproteobacteria bacterium]|nr:flagellar basal body rod protein FlgB [Rhodospirillaceae bacterium]HRJ11918.1 flagellar basal body rod protein FlgB [Alphaproteobacteria bacterium]